MLAFFISPVVLMIGLYVHYKKIQTNEDKRCREIVKIPK